MSQEKITLIVSLIAVCLFVFFLMAAAVILFRIYLKRKNTLLLEKERMSIQFEQTLLRSRLEIQEQTFNDISREIHDNIGQVLSLVRINLNTIEMPGEEGEKKLERMDDLLGKAITDLRNLSHILDADQIKDNGWIQATQKLVNDLRATGKFEVTANIAQKIPTLGTDKPIILFRMMQECVNNIIKHADAKKISFSIAPENEALIVQISDDGKGFDVKSASAGAGLRNLQSRGKLINATVSIDSIPQRGTTITISIYSTTTHNEAT